MATVRSRRLASRTLALAALAPLVYAAAPALAQRSELTIDDVLVTLVDETGQPRRIDLGDITITLANRSGSGMSAVFRVAPEFHAGGPEGSIWRHLELHWINLITADDCPASVEGAAAGSHRLPFPLIDMPRNGWDYVYRYRRGRPQRLESNADGRELRDDARDVLPWYHTTEEERMEEDSGNATGGFGQFRPGVTYGIRDLPSLCDAGGVTAFTTLLVAVVPANADGGHVVHAPGGADVTLQGGQLLVLGGFDWDWSSRRLRLDPTGFSAEDLNRALQNSNFPEWLGVEGTPVYVSATGHTGDVPRTPDQPHPAHEADTRRHAPSNGAGLGKPR